MDYEEILGSRLAVVRNDHAPRSQLDAIFK
jgi:hypothetical protein